MQSCQMKGEKRTDADSKQISKRMHSVLLRTQASYKWSVWGRRHALKITSFKTSAPDRGRYSERTYSCIGRTNVNGNSMSIRGSESRVEQMVPDMCKVNPGIIEKNNTKMSANTEGIRSLADVCDCVCKNRTSAQHWRNTPEVLRLTITSWNPL